jgi:hypothetical protein
MVVCTLERFTELRFVQNDLLNDRTVKAFRKLKRKLRRAANARRRTLSMEESVKLMNVAPAHLKTFLILAVNT